MKKVLAKFSIVAETPPLSPALLEDFAVSGEEETEFASPQSIPTHTGTHRRMGSECTVVSFGADEEPLKLSRTDSLKLEEATGFRRDRSVKDLRGLT